MSVHRCLFISCLSYGSPGVLSWFVKSELKALIKILTVQKLNIQANTSTGKHSSNKNEHKARLKGIAKGLRSRTDMNALGKRIQH